MRRIIILLLLSLSLIVKGEEGNSKNNPPIYIAFLWHMHQPIYWPGETIVQTQQGNHYPYSVYDIHNSRLGPYTNWPKDAVMKGINANLPNFGAQVSFSGSLIENLNNLESIGNGNFQNWKSHWNYIKTQNTSLGNPRIDMVGFGYHHPLMGLIEYNDIRKQIQAHKQILSQNFSGSYSKGIFPPENAFAPHMIPALADEGIEWVLVDNIHFDRAAQNYPFNTGGNIYEPNKADIINEDPGDWVQLNNLWAPTKVSAQWGHQPHFVEYTDPATGQKSRVIAVPASRYLGNEDGRGGFGALNYESVMSQLEPYNTDPDHPILVVLHHDGDNYGGGTDSYYGSNFQNFVNWLLANPSRFVCTTIEDYLEMFPPDENYVIHVENGSWSGADNGDPEFKKWLGDPNDEGYSPDYHSWSVVTAAKNYVETADDINPGSSATQNAWKYFLNSQASDYWYWDFSIDGIWDAHPTRAANLAIPYAQQVINGQTDNTGPTIFHPQREPYNPGGTEWNQSMSSDFTVWTFVYDVSGLQSVKLKYRIDSDGVNSLLTSDNETYSGGSDVGDWVEITMTESTYPTQTNISPMFRSKYYEAEVKDLDNVLLDYYVEAVDQNGNITKSMIKHVWVGNYSSGGGGGNSNLTISPDDPTNEDLITIKIVNASQGAKLHWGVNAQGSNWVTPNQVYWPNGSELFDGSGPAVESPFTGNDTLTIQIGPFNKPEQTVTSVDFVIHYNDNTWDNNNGQDYHITFGGGSNQNPFNINGSLDESATLLISNSTAELYVDWQSPYLYLATKSAQQQGGDIFLLISNDVSSSMQAPWGKSGSVASYSAFVGNESTNNYNSWFDQSGTAYSAAGNYLEAAINLEEEFGTIPNNIYLAVAKYGTDDGSSLTGQLPSGNSNGNIEADEFYDFNFVITSVEDDIQLPAQFSLEQNYPNPFNPTTSIEYSVPSSEYVSLKVYDVLGNEVATLVNGQKSAGRHEVKFNASSLSTGMYIYRIQAGNFNQVRKMMLVK
ncbi:MAG: hypothetical protein CMF23_10480 [Ignavibacteriae bacterium]|nr:hypothetical protein [Ignavibacteriota bacterium]